MNDINLYKNFSIKPLVNFSGTLTKYGGINARDEILKPLSNAICSGINIDELQAKVSNQISQLLNVESGFISSCTSAGICMSISGFMTGDNFELIKILPNTTTFKKNKILILSSHCVDYGHNILQDILITGAKVKIVDDFNDNSLTNLVESIDDSICGALFVVSHHCNENGRISFEIFSQTLKKFNVPILVDLAAEYDLNSYHDLGADITIHSSHKFLGGPTAGIVSGKTKHIRSAYLQNYGLCRPMKIGKESIVGAIVALKTWVDMNQKNRIKLEDKKLKLLFNIINKYDGLIPTISKDPTGNPFSRVKVFVDENKCQYNIFQILWYFSNITPQIAVRQHEITKNIIVLDIRSSSKNDIEYLNQKLDSLFFEKPIIPKNCDYHKIKILNNHNITNWPELF